MRRRSLFIAAVVAASLSTGGCKYVSPEAARAALDKATEKIEAVDTTIEQYQRAIAEGNALIERLKLDLASAASESQRYTIDLQIAETQRQVEMLGDGVKGAELVRDAAALAAGELEDALSAWDNPADPIAGFARMLSPLIPAPYQPLLFAGVGAASLYRSNRIRKAFGAVVRSFDEAKSDPEFKAGFEHASEKIRQHQPESVRRLVDAEQGKGIRLPV